MTETILCPAKINLFLGVGTKRPDGYHEIDTVMQSVTLYDSVALEVTRGSGIALECTDPELPCGDGNLVYRAAREYITRMKEDFRVDIHLEKRIPAAAGLAGGSSDAAGTLLALDKCIGALSENELYDIAASLGSDIPFFLKSRAARCTGRGEIVTECDVLPDCAIVIAKNASGVSTREAYAAVDAVLTEKRDAEAMLKALSEGNLAAVCENLYNSFSKVIAGKLPEVTEACNTLRICGAVGESMSGSGPSVFGIFTDDGKAEDARKKLAEKGFSAFFCRPLRER